VRLGEWDTSTVRDCDTSKGVEDCVDEPVQDIAIDRTIIHENYQKQDTHNDIALVRLRQPAILNAFVDPICLPQTDLLRQKNLDGSFATVAGFGRTETGECVYRTTKLLTKPSCPLCRNGE